MNDIIIYTIESIFTSAILFIGFLLISKKSRVKYLRVYLLGIIAGSIILPVLNIDFFSTTEFKLIPNNVTHLTDKIEDPLLILQSDAVKSPSNAQISEPIKDSSFRKIDFVRGVSACYGLVVLFLFGKLIFSFLYVLKLKNKSVVVQSSNRKYYQVNKNNFVGASFFNWIFIDRTVSNTKLINTVYLHESVHRRQLHSIDILIAEIFCIVYWVNPIAWILKKRIRQNNEFDADYSLSQEISFSTYSDHLILLSSYNQNQTIMNYLSPHSLKIRIKKMSQKTGSNLWINNAISTVIFVLAFWLVSCNDPVGNEPVQKNELQQVKTITTRFVSHQPETKSKDSKVVAVANFNEDGSFDQFIQYMTYPYNFETPATREFWDEPNKNGILLIMDGLDVSHAEKNFLYGHQWPKQYAKIATKQHPIYNDSQFNYETSISYGNADLPIELKTVHQGLINNSFTLEPVYENFEYMDKRVTSYTRFRKINKNLIPRAYRNFIKIDSGSLFRASFQYIEDNLVGIFYKNVQYKFYYEGKQIVKSEYYLNDQLYNFREYLYNEDGMKMKTKIYNVNLEPEYTIYYEYEYYN